MRHIGEQRHSSHIISLSDPEPTTVFPGIFKEEEERSGRSKRRRRYRRERKGE
jgi:hypothetical protein